jgi:hypothetical protein
MTSIEFPTYRRIFDCYGSIFIILNGNGGITKGLKAGLFSVLASDSLLLAEATRLKGIYLNRDLIVFQFCINSISYFVLNFIYVIRLIDNSR